MIEDHHIVTVLMSYLVEVEILGRSLKTKFTLLFLSQRPQHLIEYVIVPLIYSLQQTNNSQWRDVSNTRRRKSNAFKIFPMVRAFSHGAMGH